MTEEKAAQVNKSEISLIAPFVMEAVSAPERFQRDLAYILSHPGVTSTGFAKALGVSRQCLDLWKKGKRTPTNISTFILVTRTAERMRAKEPPSRHSAFHRPSK